MTPEAILIENMLSIADKHGNDVPFVLNPTQKALDEGLTGRDIVPKARQEGVSSYVLARYTIRCLTKRNTRAVVISHESDATTRMLAKVHYFLENLRPQAVVGHSSKGEITFPKMNSMFYIGTAGARAFGRGDTITNLHCSEVAFWPEAKTLVTGLMQAVPENSGEIIIESTGNGQGNWYHKMVQACVQGKSHYKLHFFDWLHFPEYNLKLTPEHEKRILDTLDEDLQEITLMTKWGLTPGQIEFRRRKLVELEFDMSRFDQEYPKTLDECFQASGTGLFGKVMFLKTDLWEKVNYNLNILKGHPNSRRKYIIGADVGGGVGRDRSIAQILDLQTLEQVGVYYTDKESPDQFGKTLADLGKMFSDAFITVEDNNYGITCLDHLARDYPAELIYTEDKGAARGANEPQLLTALGFHTSAQTKPWLIGKLRTFLANHIVLHDEETKAELSTFIEKENGKLEAEEGCFDDRVIALAMCCVALAKSDILFMPTPEQRQKVEDEFALENIIKELRGRHQEFPIARQVE